MQVQQTNYRQNFGMNVKVDKSLKALGENVYENALVTAKKLNKQSGNAYLRISRGMEAYPVPYNTIQIDCPNLNYAVLPSKNVSISAVRTKSNKVSFLDELKMFFARGLDVPSDNPTPSQIEKTSIDALEKLYENV